MRIVLIGAVMGSNVALNSLIDMGVASALIVTLPPEAAHRHSDFADLSIRAREIGSQVVFTTNINAADTVDAISAIKPDLCLVIGWSQICGSRFRACARLGSIGFHPSPLPHMRGRAVIPWTILLDEKRSGSTLFWLDEGTDSGAILLQRIFSVAEDETAKTLYAKHTANLAAMLPQAIGMVQSGSPPRIPQDTAKATFCAKRTPDDGLIDWHKPAEEILRLIRAVGEPYPGAFTFYDGEKLTIDSGILLPNSDRLIGTTGQVQIHTNNGFAVRCGDGKCVDVKAWRSSTGGKPKVHSKLGVTAAWPI